MRLRGGQTLGFPAGSEGLGGEPTPLGELPRLVRELHLGGEGGRVSCERRVQDVEEAVGGAKTGLRLGVGHRGARLNIGGRGVRAAAGTRAVREEGMERSGRAGGRGAGGEDRDRSRCEGAAACGPACL